MSKINFRVLLRPLSECQGFTEMTAPELRVLVALIENGGCLGSTGELAELSGTTEVRAVSTLTLLTEMGLIAPEGEDLQPRGGIVEEFEYRIREGEIESQSAASVAKTIRDGNLAEMISECAVIFEEPALSSEHTAILTALYTQYGLSPEYILTLAAYMATKGKPNASTLKNKAISLHKRGIDTVEELERYIGDLERENTADWELKPRSLRNDKSPLASPFGRGKGRSEVGIRIRAEIRKSAQRIRPILRPDDGAKRRSSDFRNRQVTARIPHQSPPTAATASHRGKPFGRCLDKLKSPELLLRRFLFDQELPSSFLPGALKYSSSQATVFSADMGMSMTR